MSKKFSQFTAQNTVSDNDYINITGATNRRIRWPDFLDNVFDRIVTPFIYPTVESLKEAPLRADEDNPVYVRVEETEYRLYKITNIAPGVNDITLDNGNTATAQTEYRDIGFVVGPDVSEVGALATYDNTTGTLLANGPTPSAVGVNLIEFPDSASDGYFRKKNDNTIELLTGDQLKTNLSLNNVDNTSDAQKVSAGPIFDALVLKAPLESPALTGTPTAPTASAGTNTTQIATTAFVQGELSDRIQSVATIADLRSLAPTSAGQRVTINGHTVAGIGAGDFISVVGTTTDNNGTLVDSATSSFHWERIIDGTYINVECFGAVPGQITEITSAVQAAIDWADTSPTVKEVRIPAGDWYIDTVYLRRDIALQGAGKHVTRLYQSKLPTVEGMIRADRSHDASNSSVYDLSVYGNGKVPASTNLLKGILFEEVKGFKCGRCHAENFSSYGFWAHTHALTDSQYLAEHGLFHDLSTYNVEHSFETKRAKNVRWVRCVAVGDAQYSDSAFHPWERSENISYEQCEAYGDFKDAAIKTLGSNDPGTEGNNKNLMFDVTVSLNQSGISTPNRCARVYRADDVTIKGKLRGFTGILWGGGSGNLTLDAELDVVIAGFQSGSTELASGGLFGNLLVRLSAPLGVGQDTGSAFIVQQNGAKYIRMGELRVSFITDSATDAVRFGGVSADFGTIHVRGGNTSLGVYNSTITSNIIDLAGNTGVYSVCYAENSDIEARIKSTGFAAIVANGSKINCLDGSRLEGRATVTVGAGSTLTGTAEIIADATNTADSSYGVLVDPTGQIKLTNSSLTHINAGSLPTVERLLSLGTGSKVNLSQCDLRSDRPGASIVFYTPNTMVNNCTANGVSFSLNASANKSMMIGNVVDTATADASTGSVITEVVR